MAISDKLQELIDIKQDIKVAIENKGVDMTGVAFDGYATKIDEIPAGGGGVDLSRVIPIVFQLYVSKPSSSYSLNYSISSTMLDKRFFFDINGNSYLPSEVSVYFQDTYKGIANQSITLYSSSGNYSGTAIKFKVGSLEVGLPPYYYEEEGVIVWTTGFIQIAWSNPTGTVVAPVTSNMRFIQAPNDLFDNFPEYDVLDYWNADNMFAAISPYTNRHEFKVGWRAEYLD